MCVCIYGKRKYYRLWVNIVIVILEANFVTVIQFKKCIYHGSEIILIGSNVKKSCILAQNLYEDILCSLFSNNEKPGRNLHILKFKSLA